MPGSHSPFPIPVNEPVKVQGTVIIHSGSLLRIPQLRRQAELQDFHSNEDEALQLEVDRRRV